MKDFNDALNCVGNGIVTCGRILSSDHGSHFLIDNELLRAIQTRGGLPSLCNGRWEHRLHSALLHEQKVKTSRVRYADVFGFYTDTPLLVALNRINTPSTRHHIGSHDMLSLTLNH